MNSKDRIFLLALFLSLVIGSCLMCRYFESFESGTAVKTNQDVSSVKLPGKSISLFDYLKKVENDISVMDKYTTILEQAYKTNKVSHVKPYADYIVEQRKIVQKGLEPSKLVFEVKHKLQESRINDMKSNIGNLNNKLGKEQKKEEDNINLQSIKSLNDGSSLNIDQTGTLNDSFSVYLNQGCLTYNANSTVDNQKYWAEYCREDRDDQKFNIRTIKNSNDLNTHLANEETHIFDDSSNTYPFHIIHPKNSVHQCLSKDEEGVSVQPCKVGTKNVDQRWRPSIKSRTC